LYDAKDQESQMILVVGGTGDLGSRVVTRLRSAGHEVRCLVRPGSDDERLRADGVEVQAGELTDAASLARACVGVDVVVATATSIGRQLAGRRTPSMHDVDDVGMRALVDAAEAAKVDRFVYVSYAGVDAALNSPLERAKIAVEQRLAGSQMTVCIVRPDAFQEIHLAPIGRFDIAAGKVAVFGRGDTPRRWIATDDVAALVAAVSTEPEPPRVIEVGGPEALTRNEAIAAAARLSGRKIKRQRMPRPVARIGMRLLDKRNPALASVFGAGLLQDLAAATWNDRALVERGITPRPATEFIRQQATELRPQ
jgi:uncharacterized protein YbjT (DUF2867 family)